MHTEKGNQGMVLIGRPNPGTMKGQLMIIGIFFSILGFMFVSIMMPMCYPFIDSVAGNATARGDTTTATIAGAFPALVYLCVLVGPVAWAWVGQSRQQDQYSGR
jgi:hypothetical protein